MRIFRSKKERPTQVVVVDLDEPQQDFIVDIEGPTTFVLKGTVTCPCGNRAVVRSEFTLRGDDA